MSETESRRDLDGIDMSKSGDQPIWRKPLLLLLFSLILAACLVLFACLGLFDYPAGNTIDNNLAHETTVGDALQSVAKPPAKPAVDREAEAKEAAEESARIRKEVMTRQVRVLICEESAQRYMKARTGVEFQRQIHISQANGCGWKYIMAEDAKTHDLTPEALAAAADIEPDDVPAADGETAANADELDAMKHRLSNAESEVQRLRYRRNYY